MRRFADQDSGHEWTRMENLTFECKAHLHASSRQLISRLLLKIHFSKTRTASSRFLFRPYFVIAQLPHEHFLVYGLPGVVEHR
jgi:hypothetical protein